MIGDLFHNIGTLRKDLAEDPYLISAIIVDSWGGIQSEQASNKISENKSDEVGNSYGGNSKTIGPMVAFMLNIAAENGITNFWIQHCIQNLEHATNPAKPKYKLVGGEKLQLLVHCTIYLEGMDTKDSHLLEGNQASERHADAVYKVKVGKKILVRCEKSRFVPEGRRAEFYMNFNNLQFARSEYSLFNLANNLGLLDNKGAWFYYPKNVPNPGKYNGSENFVKALQEDKDLYNQLWAECLSTTHTDALGGISMSDVLLEKDDEQEEGKGS
jgi:hypothetical protein